MTDLRKTQNVTRRVYRTENRKERKVRVPLTDTPICGGKVTQDTLVTVWYNRELGSRPMEISGMSIDEDSRRPSKTTLNGDIEPSLRQENNLHVYNSTYSGTREKKEVYT